MLLTILNYFFLNIISISIISISVCGTGLILNKFFNIGFKLEKLFFYGVLVKIILIKELIVVLPVPWPPAKPTK